MTTVYYLVPEISGAHNRNGTPPPSEGGLGVAALNMLRASRHSSFEDIDFHLVLPGTRDVLKYFQVEETSITGKYQEIVSATIPSSGETVDIVLDSRLTNINSYAKAARDINGFYVSDIVSSILVDRIKDGDIVHLNGWHFYTVARDLRLRGNKAHILLNIHIIRDAYRHTRGNTTINPWIEAIEHSDILVPVSRTYAKQIIAGENEPLSETLTDAISKKKIHGINNGLTQNPVKLDFEEKINEIAWIHRIDSRQKGLHLLQGIVEKLIASGDTWRINILGNIEKTDVDAHDVLARLEILKSKYPHLVSLDTEYTQRKKDKVLRKCKIFLCTSLFEGSPYSVMEAMHYCLIPVVTPIAGLFDVIADGHNGIISRDMSVDGFYASLKEAISKCNGAEYLKIIDHAKTSVPTAYDMFSEYRKLYKALSHQSPPPDLR
jgi:glycogen synthase